tara:strand:+ start:221 stop:448 length:228 start_codon:yes stop_codon:yes gene_type:complete
MDYLKLLYALYASYWTKDIHNRTLLSYTEFLEKLSQALVQDEEGTEIVTKAVAAEKVNIANRIKEIKDNLTEINF